MPQEVEKLRVLVVDDEPMNRDLLRRVLHHKFEISEAEDASEALSILGKEGSDIMLLLCDHLMPGQTGADLSGVVTEKWPHIPILLLTGYDCDQDVLNAHRDGHVLAVLSKPWRRNELEELIRKVLKTPA